MHTSWECQVKSTSAMSSSVYLGLVEGKLLAHLIPPQGNAVRPHLVVLEHGKQIIGDLVLSAIIISAKKDEWKLSQSPEDRPNIYTALAPTTTTRPTMARPTRQQRPRTALANTAPSSRPFDVADRRNSTATLYSVTAAPQYGSWLPLADANGAFPPPYASTADLPS